MHRKVWSCLSQGVCWDFNMEQFIGGNKSLPYLVIKVHPVWQEPTAICTSAGTLARYFHGLCWKSVHRSVKEKRKTPLEALRVLWDETWRVPNVIICILLSFLVASISQSSKSMSGKGRHYDSGKNQITWCLLDGWHKHRGVRCEDAYHNT